VRLSQLLSGPKAQLDAAQAALTALEQRQAGVALGRPPAEAAKFWSADAAVQAKIAHRLGWLPLPTAMRAHLPGIASLAAECTKAGLTDAVLLGMGGSSLAPEVFSQIFGGVSGKAG